MHRRLRWGNVARAAGAALAVALVVAWPRLAPPEPALPGTEAAPLGDQGGRPPMNRVDGAAKRAGGGVRRPRARAGAQRRGARRRPTRAAAERAARRRTIRAAAEPAAKRRTIRAGGREGGDRGGGDEDGAAVPGVGGGDEDGAAVPGVGGGREGGATVPAAGDDGRAGPGGERVAAPIPDPAPVEFGFERP